jgi:hypothetical protein
MGMKTGGGAEIPEGLTLGRQVWWLDRIKNRPLTGNIRSVGEGIVIVRAAAGFERQLAWADVLLREPGKGTP